MFCVNLLNKNNMLGAWDRTFINNRQKICRKQDFGWNRGLLYVVKFSTFDLFFIIIIFRTIGDEAVNHDMHLQVVRSFHWQDHWYKKVTRAYHFGEKWGMRLWNMALIWPFITIIISVSFSYYHFLFTILIYAFVDM